MLRVFFGSDRTAVRDAADACIASYRTTHTVVTVDATSYIAGQLTDATESVSLFGEQFLFVLDTPSADETFVTEVLGSIAQLAESTHQYIVLEHSLLAPIKKQYTKGAVVLEEFSASSKERFNTFAFADALVARDKRRLWVLLHEARLVGIADEEIIGILWWQLKAMRLAALTSSAEEAGLKTFPYSKAKQALKQFPLPIVNKTSQELLTLYHDGHAGRRNLSLALEQFVLRV